MVHVRALRLGALALGAAALLPGCGGDDESGFSALRHKTLTFIGGPIEIVQSDTPPKGSSVGDVRTFNRPLTTPSGAEAGRMDGTTAISDEVKHGSKVREYRVGTVHFTLEDGTIAIAGVYVSTPDSPVPIPGGASRPVIGGTGAYRGASGEVHQTALPGEKEKEVLDLDLPAG